MNVLAFALVALLAAPAFADTPAPPAAAPPVKPKILVLPLPASPGLDANVARTFDARLLVALEDSRRIVTVTTEDEPECTTQKCLAQIGAAADAHYVLSLSVVREGEAFTLFGTLIDSKTGATARRIELPRVSQVALAKSAPAEIVPQIVGAPSGPVVLGVVRPTRDEAQAAAVTLQERLANLRAFKVAPLDGADRSGLTHRAEITFDDLTVRDRRRTICDWHEGTLVGTFAITELATGRVVFTKTVSIAEQRRTAFTSRQELVDIMLASAVEDWLSAFQRSGVIAQLAKRR
jgi:hypothetical protein